MAYAPDPAFQKLFTVFTSDPESMGAHLAQRIVALAADDPLLVMTGTDVVLFPGSGRLPRAESFPAYHARFYRADRYFPSWSGGSLDHSPA